MSEYGRVWQEIADVRHSIERLTAQKCGTLVEANNVKRKLDVLIALWTRLEATARETAE